MYKYNDVWDCQVSQFEDPQDINKYWICKIDASSNELELDKVNEFWGNDNPAGILIWGANVKANNRDEAKIKFKELLINKKKKDITDFLKEKTKMIKQISAKEANTKTIEVLNNCISKELNEIMNNIQNEVNKGKFYYIADGCLHEVNKRRLEELGYKVETSIEPSYYSISWENL